MDAPLPPLNTIFDPERDKPTLRLFDTLEITSTAQLAVFSRDELADLEFITNARAYGISAKLSKRGVQQREYGEALADFLLRVFGGAKQAPAGVLHVAMVRDMGVTRAELAPLQLVRVLEHASPNATVSDALHLTANRAQALISAMAESGDTTLSCDDPGQDLFHLRFRLLCAGLRTPR